MHAPTCKDCKHWTFLAYRIKDEQEYGAGKCRHPKLSLDTEGSDVLCVHSNMDGGWYGMETGEDFGCVHWEAQ